MPEMGKIRPQSLVARLCATMFSCIVSYRATKMGGIEIITAVIGGVIGIIGGVSLRVMENE